jgi:peptide deformylase
MDTRKEQNVKLKIVQAGDPVLRQPARPLAQEEIRGLELQTLIEWMRETMRGAPGVGLAAPQVGLPIQLAVIEDRAELLAAMPPEILRERARSPVPFHVIVNPVITLEEERAEFFEGCLSLPGFSALVPRALRVRVDCLDHEGEPSTIYAEGWYARILQHEIDHLRGVMYIDRMRARSFTGADNLKLFWDKKPIPEVRAALGL